MSLAINKLRKIVAEDEIIINQLKYKQQQSIAETHKLGKLIKELENEKRSIKKSIEILEGEEE